MAAEPTASGRASSKKPIAVNKNDPATRNLSKLLSKLLRHEAVNLRVPITADGYVAMVDAVNAINGRELRDIVGSTAELGETVYSAADIEGVVQSDDKQRFVMRQVTSGRQLRAAQGHSLEGVVVQQVKLTLETAPPLAVHGSYWKHWDGISKKGLSRMSRHQIHLARELPGKGQVISGMRSDAELQIWVDVHRAMRDDVIFLEAPNGVILCDGTASDGVLPSKYFTSVIDVTDGANLLDGCRWSLLEWLRGISKLSLPIAAALMERQDPLRANEEEQLRALRLIAQLGPAERRAEVLRRLIEGRVLQQLADAIVGECESLIPVGGGGGEAPISAYQLHEKFVHGQDNRPIALALCGSELFYGGLSSLVGRPQPNLSAAIRQEHCSSSDSSAEFVANNYGTKTTSRVEYWFVFDPARPGILEELGIECWPSEPRLEREEGARAPSRAKPREALAFAAFADKLREKNFALQGAGSSKLLDQELLCARLYTGPCYQKYAAVLRSAHATSPPFFKEQFEAMCKGNWYQTTIHVINSAVVKLSKLTTARKLYRGLANTTLPDELWLPDGYNVRGGVELSFQSATENRRVAFDYARGKGADKAAIVFELQQGLVNRGADLSWCSQYPHEHEVLFPPLSSIEIRGTRIESNVLVLEVQLCVNLTSQTIEQTIARMQTSHLTLVDSLLHDMRAVPTRALDPLKDLRSEAEASAPEWFNSAANFIQATESVLGARDKVLQLLGAAETWASETDAAGRLQQRLRAAAELCASEGCHREAISVLRLRSDAMTGRSASPTMLAWMHGDAPIDKVPVAECKEVLKKLGVDWQAHGTLLALVQVCAEPDELIDTLIRRVLPPAAHWPDATSGIGGDAGGAAMGGEGAAPPAADEPPCEGEQVLAYYPKAARKWVKSTFVRWAGGGGGERRAEVKLHGHKARSVEHVLLLADSHGAGGLLRQAARAGEVRVVDRLLRARVSPLYAEPDATTTLMVAAQQGQVEVCRRLLADPQTNALKDLPDMEGRSPHALAEVAGGSLRRVFEPSDSDLDFEEGGSDVTPLMRAAKVGDLTTAEALLESGADASALTARGCGALGIAAEEGNATVLTLLCQALTKQRGGDVAPLPLQQAWMLAARNGRCNAMTALLDELPHGMNCSEQELLRHRDDRGRTALMYACRVSCKEAVDTLLLRAASPEEDCAAATLVNLADTEGSTALMAACVQGNMGIIRTLLHHRADVNALKRGPSSAALKLSALSVATAYRHARAVRTLLCARADVAVDVAPRSAGEAAGEAQRLSLLGHAAQDGREAIVRILLEADVDVNAHATPKRDTPLGLAAAAGCDQIVRILIERRADCTFAREDGMTPLMRAARSGQSHVAHELLKVLETKDIDVKRAKDGQSALSLARSNGEDAVVQMLLSRGAEDEGGGARAPTDDSAAR